MKLRNDQESSMYLTKDMTKKALLNMVGFHKNMGAEFSCWGMDFKSNLGRRNVVMSQAQEYFFAKELSKAFSGVESDGRTGKADIVIGEIDKELECKLTSGTGKYNSFSLQTDYATLENKERLDYLYVLADGDFKRFAVLLFKGLTSDDFFPPASGSRGKSRMRKEMAMLKCQILWGDVTCRNTQMIDTISSKISKTLEEMESRILELSNRISSCSDRAVKKRENLLSIMDREIARYQKKISSLNKKQDYWKDTPSQFTFNLKPIK